MTKVFHEKELVKRLLEEKDTLMGVIHYKSVSLKKDGVFVLFQMKTDLSFKDTFLKNIDNKPVPYILLCNKEAMEKIIKEIEFEKEEREESEEKTKKVCRKCYFYTKWNKDGTEIGDFCDITEEKINPDGYCSDFEYYEKGGET